MIGIKAGNREEVSFERSLEFPTEPDEVSLKPSRATSIKRANVGFIRSGQNPIEDEEVGLSRPDKTLSKMKRPYKE